MKILIDYKRKYLKYKKKYLKYKKKYNKLLGGAQLLMLDNNLPNNN